MDSVCLAFINVIDILSQTLGSTDVEAIVENVEAALQELKDTYSPLKDDVYYANMICKELYCKVRSDRAQAMELLECSLKVLADNGGKVEPYWLGESEELICEAIRYTKQAKKLLCGAECCDTESGSCSCASSLDCLDTDSCGFDLNSACDTSSCGVSLSDCCDTSSCDTSMCSSSVDCY